MTNSLHIRVVERASGQSSTPDAMSLTDYLNKVLDAGTNGQIVTSRGPGASVVWATPSGSFAGPIGVNGSTPPAKAAFPGTATGTDATVINAVITILVNLGFCAGS